jgi:hypothetical protein
MTPKNRSVPVDTVLPHVNYQNLEEAIAWLTKVFGFQECYRYGDGPSGGQMQAGKAVIQVRQARDGQESPAQLGLWTMWTRTTLVRKQLAQRFWRSRMRQNMENISTRLKTSTGTTGSSRSDRSLAEWGAVVKR